MSDFRDLDFMWSGGETRRYHGFRLLMEDTVGHHSFNVACIIMRLRPDASAHLLRAALKHDMAEHVAGDMPAPTKRALPDYLMLPEPHRRDTPRTFREVFGEYEDSLMAAAGVSTEDLMPCEEWVLKLADALDGMRFCIQELRLGNRTPRFLRCYEAFEGYVAQLLWPAGTRGAIDMKLQAPGSPHALPVDKELYLHLRDRWYRASKLGEWTGD